MDRRTVIVEGPLAFRIRRLQAARQHEANIDIMTLPSLAARLAGGFSRSPVPHELFAYVNAALAEGGFADFESLRQLPGMTRALVKTLGTAWLSDASLATLAPQHARLADLARVEERIRAQLPAGVLLPPDLRSAAIANIRHARSLFGEIELHRLTHIAPVWRPLIQALATATRVRWLQPGTDDRGWFPGTIDVGEAPASAPIEVASCADPRAEAVEALRWARELIAARRATPDEIAICSASTHGWDAHVHALASSANLPVHFSHGLRTLSSYDGQACAALADLLLNGLSQERVRRFLRYRRCITGELGTLPPTWDAGISREAALFDLEQWRRALDMATRDNEERTNVRAVLMTALTALSEGIGAARDVGKRVLRGEAFTIWNEALERAPATALEYALQESRFPDGRDPGASIVWCPASHLAAEPRPFVWLLGMNARSWPRRQLENPLVPSHILARHVFDADPVAEQDRRAFRLITGAATGACVLSLSRRSAEGTLLSASPLVKAGSARRSLKRGRIPAHAVSESDRLLARPAEAATTPEIAQAMTCWHAWERPELTAHDGQIRADHPVIMRTLEAVQSASSLRFLIRDPLGFAWRYGLGWRPVAEEAQPLSLDPRAYGELVHELLKRTVDALEPQPGFTRATRHELEQALASARAHIHERWPLERPVPPALLWHHFLDTAEDLALRALTFDETFLAGTRSWTEVAFGVPEADAPSHAADVPWPPTSPVVIPGTDIRLRGSIDRLELTAAGTAVRVSDYKTGALASSAERIALGGGTELQHVVYALAAKQLLPEVQRMFLPGAGPTAVKLDDVDGAIAQLTTHVSTAIQSLRQGFSVPGPDTTVEWNDFRLALPANATVYLARKRRALAAAFGTVTRAWSAP
jgi:hypothetical protein